MRIVHLIQRFAPAIGGAEFWCEGVTAYFTRRGYEIEVLTLGTLYEADLWGPLPPPEREAAVGPVDRYDGVGVRRYPLSPTPWGLLRLAEQLGVIITGPFSTALFRAALAAARRADVVHLHQYTGVLSFWGMLAARLARRPAVITPYSHPGDRGFDSPAVGWLLRRADAVVAVTPFERELFIHRGVSPRRIIVSTNAIDPARYTTADPTLRDRVRACWGLDRTTPLILFVGRKSSYKDIPVLIEAAERLAQATDFALVLLGPSSEWYEANRRAWAGRGFRLIDAPAVPEPTKIAVLRAADVLVQPSRYEAFGTVFLEAWASGLPVVGAAHGALPGVIGDGGLTFATGDATCLADKLTWLIAHPEEGRAMAQRGRERAARDYTWERVGAAVEEAYAIAVSRTSTAGAFLRPGRRSMPLVEARGAQAGTTTPRR